MTSGVSVSNPEQWHIYPAGAHHKLTECSPTLHAMINKYQSHLREKPKPSFPQHNTIEDNEMGIGTTWRNQKFDTGTIVAHAQKMAEYLEKRGITVYDILPGATELSFHQVVEAFSDCVDDAFTQHDKWQKEKAEAIARAYNADESPVDEASPMTNDASPTFQSSLSAAHEPHKCARAMLIVHNDNSETMTSFDHPIAQKGWKFRNLNGVPMLVIGHGVPRRHIPLANVKFMDLLTEDEL